MNKLRWFRFVLPVLLLFAVVVGGIFNANVVYADAIDLYWVGGSGNWSDTAHWSASSGGAGGHAAPTSTNSVFFDVNSGFTAISKTVTLNTTGNCLNMTWNGVAETPNFALGTFTLNIYGSLVLDSTMTTTGTTNTWAFVGSGAQTITTNGVTMAGKVNDAITGGGSLTLAGDTVTGSDFTVTSGTFDTSASNYNLTSGGTFGSTNTNTRTITLNDSTVTCVVWDTTTTTNLTFNYDTSEIVITGSNATPFKGGGLTFYEVTYNGTATQADFSGANTYLNFTALGSAQDVVIRWANDQIIGGTLTFTGNSASNRISMRSTSGARTINSAINSFANCDFQYITAAGAGDWDVSAIPGSSADLGSNTGITFSANIDRYWVANGGQWTGSDTHWSYTTGGPPDKVWIPTSTTNANFDANSFTLPAQTVSIPDYTFPVCRDMVWTGVTNNPKLYMHTGYNGTDLDIYGDMILDSGMSWQDSTHYSDTNVYVNITGTGATHNIDTDGVVVGARINISDNTGTTNLLDNLVISPTCVYPYLSVGSGNFNMGTFSVTVTQFSYTPSIGYFVTNPGTITVRGAGTLSLGNYQTYADIIVTGSGAVAVASVTDTTVDDFTYTPVAGVGSTLSFASDFTINGVFTANGTSGSNRPSITSSVPATQRAISAASITITNANFRDIDAEGASSPWNLSGQPCGDLGNNVNIIFIAGTNVYWVGNSGTWSASAHWAATSGGGAGSGRVPLPQDTAIFNAVSFNLDTQTVTLDATPIGGINTVAITHNPTFTLTGSVSIYGDVSFGVHAWTTTTGTLFAGRGTQTINTAAVSLGGPVYFYNYNAAALLAGPLTCTGTMYLVAGSLTTANYAMTAAAFDSVTVTTYTRSLTLGSTVFVLNGTGAITKWSVSTTNFTLTAGTSTINMTNSGVSAQVFTGAGLIYNNVTISGAGNYQMTISSHSNTFNGTLLIDRSLAAKTVVFPSGQTQTVQDFAVTPALSSTVVTLKNSSSKTVWTLSKTAGVVYADYLDIQYSVTTGGASFYAGTHSTILDGTFTNSSGVVVGSPVNLYEGSVMELNVTTVGTFVTSMGSAGLTGIASTHDGSTVTVTGSPKAFGPGSTGSPVTTAGTAPGLIDVVVTGSGWNPSAPTPPTIITNEATAIGSIDAYGNCTVSSLGAYIDGYVFFQVSLTGAYTGEEVDSPEQYITTADDYTQLLEDLTVDTPYHYRAAIRYNVTEYVYGSDKTFTTTGKPVVATGSVANITYSSATLQGSIVAVGIYPPDYVYFQYSLTGDFLGEETTTIEQMFSIVTGFTHDIASLTAGTTYFYRAACRYVDTGVSKYVYGSTLTFVTSAAANPSITTLPAALINNTGATLQGNLTSLGTYSSVFVSFEYGLTTAYGATTPDQLFTAPGNASQIVTGLQPSTTYHYRAVMRYNGSSTTGLDVSFTTSGPGSQQPGTDAPDILSIVDAKVISGYLTPGDQMYLIAYKAIYTNGTPTEPASDYFVIQVLNNGAVVGQWSLPDWGYNPVGLYLGPSSALPYGGLYTIKIVGIDAKWPTPPIPSTTRILSSGDWLGTDLTQFDNWVLQTAKSIGQYYDVELVTYTASGSVLNATGCALFNRNISGMSQVRPQLCSVYATRPSPTPGPSGTAYTDQWNAATNLGPYINGLLLDGATTMSMDQVAFNNLVGVLIWCVIVMILLFAFKGSFMAALLAAPCLMGISWAGLLIPTIIVVLAVINVALLAYALLPRGTG